MASSHASIEKTEFQRGFEALVTLCDPTYWMAQVVDGWIAWNCEVTKATALALQRRE